jgi:high-affinity iron transporter
VYATALIVFRESLEAALFVGIIAAATRELAGRSRWLSGGIGLGALGAVLLALMAERLSGWMDGLGQDLVNIAVLATALVLLLWHCIWVSAHASEMVQQARAVGHSVKQGQRTPWALLLVVALAVLREGAETVLFVGGSLVGSTAVSGAAVLTAGALGLAGGVLVGAAVYAGLTHIPTRRVFAVTNLLVAVLAASIASQLMRAVAQAGFVEAGTAPLWDTSSWLSMQSPLGALLHGLVGYDAQPSALQALAYAAVLLLIALATRWLAPRPRGR